MKSGKNLQRVFLVAAALMFSFFFVIKWLFLRFVRMGYSLAFEWDLSGLMPVVCSLLVYIDWSSVIFRLSVLLISGRVFVYCCFYIHGEAHPARFC